MTDLESKVGVNQEDLKLRQSAWRQSKIVAVQRQAEVTTPVGLNLTVARHVPLLVCPRIAATPGLHIFRAGAN